MRGFRFVFVASLVALGACGDNGMAVPEPICGDGIVEGDEACDDGNDSDTDACTNTCKVAGCGDGVLAFSEACDDGNTVDGDGCDSNCTESFCGNGVLAPDETCDDGNRVSGDGCDNNCLPTACGNGEVAGAEECDDANAVEGDGCDTNCTTSACGNGITGGTEQCDDGNTDSADGCSATCATETAEVEPNDDGMTSTGATGITGNDFATAAPDANPAITDSTTIVGAISPIGDEDIFKLSNTGTLPVRVKLDTWNLAAGFGIGTSCATSIDTGMQVKNAAGAVLASNDNRVSSDRCSSLVIGIFPGESVYVQIVEFGDNAAIASYALDIVFEDVVCGDGDVGPGEQCDDTNTTAGDGCSATCQIEGAVTEIEPNEDGSTSTGGSGVNGNDFGTTHPLNNGLIADDFTLLGALSPAGDEDIFAFTNTRTNPVEISFDVWSMAPGFGVGVPCGASTFDTGLVIRDSAGGSLASNDDRNSSTDACSALKFSLLPGQFRFAHLVEFGDNATIASYALIVKYTDIVCGDGSVGLGEQCDDSNTTSGDGCSATCQIEPFCGDMILQPIEQCDDGNMMNGDGCSSDCAVENAVTEVEPNDDGSVATGGSTTGNDFDAAAADANGAFTTSTLIAGRITPAGDEDVFAFHNPGTTAVTAEFNIWNNAPGFGVGVACGTSIDTYFRVQDADGTSLASNDDRNGSSDRCSRLSFGILPGQTVYAYVLEFGDNAEIASYTLDVVYTPVPCGDGIVGFGEQCDDSNASAGDGCSTTCQLENAANEVEPNEDGSISTGTSTSNVVGNDFATANADANGAFTTSKRIIGRLNPAGDEDVFAFRNPTAGALLARFDTWNLAEGKGIGVPCPLTTFDTGINIRSATGVLLATNDDRNGTADRCSGLTYQMDAGETVYVHIVEQDDNSTHSTDYVLDVVYTPIVCGDGFVGPTEECDDMNTTDGDGCSATCQWELVCGNGVLQAGETCDDANSADNDGCSSTCAIENNVSEIEPNDTSSDAMLNAVQIAGDMFVSGAIGAAGDVDRFQVTVTTATTVRFETFTSWGDCSTATLDVRLFDSASNPLVADLEGTGIDECGAITTFLAAGTYYVQVEERGNNSTVAAYLLQAAFQSDSGTETEPNETTAQASTNLVSKTDTYVFGDHMSFGDVDVYAITVPPNGSIRAEIIEGSGAETCESGGIDSRLLLLDATGAVMAEDNASGRGLCSLIDGTGSTPLDATARNTTFATQTYYLAVQASAFATTNGGQFVYRLQVTVR